MNCTTRLCTPSTKNLSTTSSIKGFGRTTEFQPSNCFYQSIEEGVEYFNTHFLNQKHETLGCESPSQGPVCISFKRGERTNRLLIRTRKGSEVIQIENKVITKPWYRRLWPLDAKDALSALDHPFSGLPFKSINLKPEKSLLDLDMKLLVKNFKFGVGYVNGTQSTFRDTLHNTTTSISDAYSIFLQYLGNKIAMFGWKGYRGGLDIQDPSLSCVYNQIDKHELVFHVSHMLPYAKNEHDRDQLDRKRYLGNDIVMIVFSESTKEFDVQSVESRPNQAVIIVKACYPAYNVDVMFKQGGKKSYSISMHDSNSFLRLIIQIEKECYSLPEIATRLSRTRSSLIKEFLLC